MGLQRVSSDFITKKQYLQKELTGSIRKWIEP